jgi:hypothetical protein
MRTLKRIGWGQRGVLALVFLGLLVSTLASAAPKTVTLGTLAPEGTSYHRMLLELREKWRNAPGGGANLHVQEIPPTSVPVLLGYR